MKIRESIYSLMLLMALAIGGGGVFASLLCNCSDNHHADHHHCSTIEVECEAHNIAIEHPCATNNEISFEYIVSKVEYRVTPLLLTLFADYKPIVNTPQLSKEAIVDDDSPTDLYRGLDLSSGLLRAPPALI